MAFDGAPPTIAASSEVAMVPPCANAPRWSDDREDARKVWDFEQITAHGKFVLTERETG